MFCVEKENKYKYEKYKIHREDGTLKKIVMFKEPEKIRFAFKTYFGKIEELVEY